MEQETSVNKNDDPKLLAEQPETGRFLGSGEPEKTQRRFRKINAEMLLLVVLGFLIGVVIKTEASRRFTIGYEDYQVAQNKQGFDIEKIEKDLVQKMLEEKNQGGSIDGNQ
jgi:hypothetical protein